MKKMFAYLLLRRIFCLDEDIILSIVPSSNKKILDLGCGYGYISYLLAKKFPSSQVVGIDINSSKIYQARKNFRLKNLRFFVSNASKINIKKKFDVIIAIDLFHHILLKNHEEVLNEVRKHLVKNGFFILRDINKGSTFKIFNTLHDVVFNRCCPNYNFISEWKKLLRKFNLEIDKIFYLPKLVYPYLYIVSSKK
jgi:ubiquinone/menaquinone biosynthesis C-methylase UbiE